jgi:hypothetical protein
MHVSDVVGLVGRGLRVAAKDARSRPRDANGESGGGCRSMVRPGKPASHRKVGDLLRRGSLPLHHGRSHALPNDGSESRILALVARSAPASCARVCVAPPLLWATFARPFCTVFRMLRGWERRLLRCMVVAGALHPTSSSSVSVSASSASGMSHCSQSTAGVSRV